MARELTGDAGRRPVVDGDLPEVVVADGTLATCAFLRDGDVDAVVVAVAPAFEAEDGVEPRSGTVDASTIYGVDLAELADRDVSFDGAAGQHVTVELPQAHARSSVTLPWAGLPPRIVLLGIGSGSPRDLRRAGAALARATDGLGRVVSVASAREVGDGAEAFVEGYFLAAYRVPRFGGADAEGARIPGGAEQLVLLGDDVQPTIDAANAAASATWLVRDLANVPANIKGPEWFAARASALAAAAGLVVDVLGPAELAAQGFGAILAVGAAAERGPRLVTVSYDPVESAKDARHVVVVGKGITYDTGGISIKPRESMVPMKTDMAGAAVALATVLDAARAGLAHRVTAVLPLAENHLGAASYRPGDVIRTWSGATVEVANTDAEGRLVLADALAWSAATLAPDLMVDVATLTGAVAVGLGRTHAALYATDDDLAARVERAGEAAGELVWRMPLVDEYRAALRSDVADLRNVPRDPPGAGSVVAALFLEQFVADVPWVHLDVNGVGRSASDKHELSAGPTGFGARLLGRFLRDL
ncbi:leucyl aminopeptidase [Sediminihabitans luteus]|uniref:Probable cytosol aminopeptidase n=1 Tax=Sediminihabitans luteus TaxID=1138585 RepID=A0A2M9CYI6_9CELL|nr:M17 family metallopeptidase [Sediminihabitans luteus]PJJ76994.1 leucyl aminopeptidase [Sediminihabitans luteus]GII99635.1 leucyl aminopeptidase [Sediminihabitans luteus]